MVDPLSYFLFQPVLPDWCNKGHGKSYQMVHIKEPLLLIDRVAHVVAAGFLSLSILMVHYHMYDAI